MRFLVLGAGAQGSAAALELLREPEVERVALADLRVAEPPGFLRPHLGSRLGLLELDARSPEAVARAVSGSDAVLCALPYHFNYEMSRIAVREGRHFADLGGNTPIVERQLGLDAEARDKGVTVVPDCGLAPGLANILGRAGMDELDEPVSVRMWVGGLPEVPTGPLGYTVVYSLEGVLDYYTHRGTVLRGGEPTAVDPLSEVETLEFPGLGTLEAFHTAGGVSTMPERYRGRLRTLEYKTLRYPGHATIMRAIRDLGLLDEEPVEVDGARISPRDFFIERVTPKLLDPDCKDLVVLRVQVAGRLGGADAVVTYDLVDRYDEENGITAMMRCTGYSLALVGLLQARGEVAGGPGARTAEEAVPASPYLEALARRGVRVVRTGTGAAAETGAEIG